MFKTLMNFLPQADLLYVALFAALGGWALYERYHLIHEGKAEVIAQVKATTEKLTAENNAKLAAQAAADAITLKNIEASYASSIAVSDAFTASLVQRLRDNARSGSSAVPGNTAAPGGPDAAPAVADSVTEAVAGVAEAAGRDADKVIALQQFITKECH